MTAACPACDVAPLAAQTARAGTPNIFLSLPTIHCAACIRGVEHLLATLPGVTYARVNLSLKRVAIASDLPVSTLTDALAKAGFEAHELNPDLLDQTTDPKGRDLLFRLGLAGFAMMNVMLLSVAVWSGATDATRDLFHLISAMIAVPVVLYSGQPFFQSAMSALRGRRLNMDVPISLAILLATGMSLYESLNSGAHAYFDAALSLTFFLLIGRYLDHRTRASAHSAARELSALEQPQVQRLDPTGRAVPTALSALAIGDRLLIATGMRLPVDGTLEDTTAQLDRSFITGESDAAVARSGDMIRAGEINLGAPITVSATAVGQDTTLRRIAAMVETAENARNRYTDLADRAAAIYAPAVHLLALAAFLGWAAWDGDLRHALNVAIAVLIITCPCALGLAVPAVSTTAISVLYRMGFLVKSGSALERLAEVDRAVFDKTGTLTLPGASADLNDLPAQARGSLLALAQSSSHPVSRAIATALEDVTPAELTDIREIPGQGIEGMQGDTKLRLGADARGTTFTIGAQVFPIALRERLRPGADQALRALTEQGLEPILLSGDTETAVSKIAQTLSIAEHHARMSPQAKHDHITALREAGHKAVMIGDGLNDAAPLVAAHASVAPASAIDATRAAADIVLLHESMENLPAVLRIAQKARQLSLQNFAIALAYNAVAVPVALMGLATPLIAALAMSASSITVLLNALRVRNAS